MNNKQIAEFIRARVKEWNFICDNDDVITFHISSTFILRCRSNPQACLNLAHRFDKALGQDCTTAKFKQVKNYKRNAECSSYGQTQRAFDHAEQCGWPEVETDNALEFRALRVAAVRG